MAEKVKGLHVEINGDVSGLRKALYDMEKELYQTEAGLKSINKAIKLDPSNVQNLATKQGLLTRSISETQTALDKERAEMKRLEEEGADPLSKEYVKLQGRITELTESLKDQIKQLSVLSPTMESFLVKMGNIGENLERFGQKSRAFSTAMKTVGVASVESALQYEESVASIKKVVKDLSDETVNDLKQIAVETGTAFQDLATYATIGGTLGLAEKDITSFTKVMNDLNTATDGSIFGEEGAKKVARFMNVMHEDMGEVENFGSAIVYVADQFAATADEVLDVSTNLSGLSVLSGVTSADLIGLAAELKNLGVTSNVAGTSITKTMLQIEKDAGNGVEELKGYAKIAGMSAKQFADAWSKDPVDAFLRFTDGLKTTVIDEVNDSIAKGTDVADHYAEVLGMTRKEFESAWSENNLAVLEEYAKAAEGMDEGTVNASKALQDLDITAVRVMSTLLRLAGNGNEVRDAIADASSAWEKGTALAEKAGTMYDTTARQIKGAKEAIKQAGAELGKALLPAIKDTADFVKMLAEKFNNLNPAVKEALANAIVVGATISPLTLGLGKLAKGISGVGLAIGSGSNLLKYISVTSKLESYIRNSTDSFVPYIKNVSDMSNTQAILNGKMGETQKTVAELVLSLKNFVALNPAGAIGLTTSAIMLGLLAWGDQKAKIDDNTKTIETYREEIAKLGDEADVAFQGTITSLDTADVYKARIDELVESISGMKKGSDEYKESVALIEDLVGNLNEALGGSYVYFDEETGKLKTVADQADLTSQAYTNLANEIKRSAWLEAHKEEYTKALELQSTAYQQMMDANDKYISSRQELSRKDQKVVDEIIANFDIMNIKNREWGDVQAFAISKGLEDWTAVKQAVEDYRSAYSTMQNYINLSSESILADYEAIKNASAENVDQMISDVDHGYAHTETKIDEMQAKVDEYLAKRDIARQNALKAETEEERKFWEDTAKMYEDGVAYEIEELDKLGVEYGTIYNQITEGSGKTRANLIEDAEETFQIVNTSAGNTADSVTGVMETMGEESGKQFDDIKQGLQEIDDKQIADKEYTVIERVKQVFETAYENLKGWVSGGTSGGSGGFGSGGFGFDPSVITDNFRTAQQNITYASSGYNLVVNNNFSVSALDKRQAQKFSQTIINQIDESLGRRLR